MVLTLTGDNDWWSGVGTDPFRRSDDARLQQCSPFQPHYTLYERTMTAGLFLQQMLLLTCLIWINASRLLGCIQFNIHLVGCQRRMAVGARCGA